MKLPSFYSYCSYCYFFPSIIAGPGKSYYMINFLNKKN